MKEREVPGEESVSEKDLHNPRQILRAFYLERRAKNSSYSLRAFARDMGLSPSLLSLIWSGKRSLTVKQATQISILLSLNRAEATAFIEATLLSLPGSAKISKKVRQSLKNRSRHPIEFRNYDVERFKAISQWYHVAILDLTTTENFRYHAGWIARRLDISTMEARDALERLLSLGLLEEKEGTVKKVDVKIRIPTKSSEVAVRSFHQQMISKALDALKRSDSESFQSRLISSATLTLPKKKLGIAQEKIHRFQQEMIELFEHEPTDEVYQLNMQLFPLTHTVPRGESK